LVDAEECDCRIAKLAGSGPHQAMRIGEAQHAMGHAPLELAVLRVDIAGVELRVVTGQSCEGHQVCIGDRAGRAAKRQADVEVGELQADGAWCVAHACLSSGVNVGEEGEGLELLQELGLSWYNVLR